MQKLLPPLDLAPIHAAILQSIDAQLSLKDTNSKLTGDQRSEALGKAAKSVCTQYSAFRESVAKRQIDPKTSPPSFAISFRPMGTPTSFALNSKGQFSVDITNSIDTPLGTIAFSASGSTATPQKPKRVVIRSLEYERVLLLDRPFEIFVPARYGVRVSNTDTDLILYVLEPPRAALKNKRNSA
jgi:hypothetical protein